ncbi:HxlR family transcriptional regulator [Staphylococcus microti]|uniref:Transcriptional regulator n=1 Tax=Staphylococcus microti TaxID=569857 RepID=A0A0D6XPR7_9STAP|nr:helix-turn-helix domain-containing protein [Staphylococcus microti]KIX90784.1 HxlR family transcriptional regulator [Staphylococcus microti]PNZ81608.1 transcriptional regulator [Staphylococcus microti]SUM57444.1 transcriptional regulator [Staphylococcus microti]
MVKICNDGFTDCATKEHKDIHHIMITQNILSGRYKHLIIWFLKEDSKRFTEIQQLLHGISQGSLTKQLRELEKDGVIHRTVYPEVPPKVVYHLTDKGQKLVNIIEMMEKFGSDYTQS